MKIHEYQAKSLFRKYGIPIPAGEAVFDVSKAREIATKLIEDSGTPTLAVKAQIHAGGRGKGGGVRVVQGAEAAEKAAGEILGMTLVTPQTGPEGKTVRRLLIEQGLKIEKELYVGMLVDRDSRQICLLASTEGGVEIERTAAEEPEKIHKVYFDPDSGLPAFAARKLAFSLGLTGPAANRCAQLLQGPAKLLVAEDASLVEINPLVVTSDEKVIALDAKVNFDDNAAFRHKDHAALADPDEEDPVETTATALGFSYVGMDGDIGCCVNGAGLAMATMDMIQHVGGMPANFLDVGGGADSETVKKAFQIILSDPRVRAIFVNIFGGILRCDVLAEGVVQAVKEMGISVPLVVRLEGTHVDVGRKILAESGLQIIPAVDMGDGARRVVALAREAAAAEG